ncbi:uncharacterized protein LOC143555278 [Bidens hawaiensis]|uniref:uncharacterized protein LOC143555278 n=1 Tax=Bidens hawaiensis TaxID=980011 RepID=UPI00404A4243
MKLTSPPLDTLEPMLNESIYHYLAEFHKGRTDFSELGSIFFRLIQSMTDPPLEFIWFYSAITFPTLTHSQQILLPVKDLFHSLVSFRDPNGSGHSKPVSLVAPVLYRLVKLKCEVNGLNTEVIGLVDEIIGYVIMCCNDGLVEQEVRVCESAVSWVGLVPIWIADEVKRSEGRVDGFKLFFPLSSDEIRRGVNGGDCGMSYLAAVVMVETFLFRLCLMFESGASRMDLCKDVKSCAGQIIQGFKKSSSFLVMLFKLLLEPSLPVGELLAKPDELILRRVLYEVVLDFGPLLGCDKEIVILWLFVTNSALQFARENGDPAGVGYYLNAFSTSQLPHLIISWVTGVTVMKPTVPDISSPEDIIGWLLLLEQQGLKVCDHNISELHEKALKCKDDEVKDGQTMVEDVKVKEGQTINGRRKRESTGFWEVQKHMKVVKGCHENLGDDGNSVADQEMVDMVH